MLVRSVHSMVSCYENECRGLCFIPETGLDDACHRRDVRPRAATSAGLRRLPFLRGADAVTAHRLPLLTAAYPMDARARGLKAHCAGGCDFYFPLILTL